LPQRRNVHVVEQDGVNADRQRRLELRERVDLDLDLDQVPNMRAGARSDELTRFSDDYRDGKI
jgi:hypothetical protein